MSAALAAPASVPLPEGPALWVEAEPDCPPCRTWLGDLLAAPGRVTPVVAVSRAPLADWAPLRAEPGWDALVVVSDPEGATLRERFPADPVLLTTAAWVGADRVAAGVPEVAGDPVWRAFLAFAADPAGRPELPEGQSLGLLTAYARHASTGVRIRIAKRLRRPADAGEARLAVDLADLLLEPDAPSAAARRAAARLVDAAAPALPDDPVRVDLAAALAGARAEGPAPAEVTGPALADDVRFLAALLRDHYSGFAGVAAAAGDWDAHVSAVAAEALARPTWSLADAFALLADGLLAAVRDAHFHLRAEAADGAVTHRWLAPDVKVWFTDLVTDDAGVVVAGPDGWVGRTLDLPTVGAPAPGGPWRFPTLRAGGAPGALVGVLAVEDPGAVEVDGEALPVHRSRSFWTRADPLVPWARPSPDVLEVRTMDPSALEGLVETAPELRASPRVVLDLRGNWGGSDRPASDWIAGFSGGTYRDFAIADALPDGRWLAFVDRPWTVERAPYAGRLEVLVDHDVCSSGETFLFLAAQVPGARVVGENSSGCLGNGNVRGWPRLPATRIRVDFGVTAFWGGALPAAEGVGVLPAVWLDEPDPVGFLRALPDGPPGAAR